MKAEEIIRKPVKSSNIKAIGYDRESMTLVIEFKGGQAYKYNPISMEGYKKLVGAESIGKFFNSNIRDNELIDCTKLTLI